MEPLFDYKRTTTDFHGHVESGPLVPTVAFFFDFASAVSTAAVAQ